MTQPQSNHDSIGYNPEVEINDDEDRYADPDRMMFMRSCVKVGNWYALTRTSNGDKTFVMFEDIADSYCHNDFKRRRTRSFSRNNGSNCLSRNVSPNRNPSVMKNVSNRLSPNVVSPNQNSSVMKKVLNCLSQNVHPNQNSSVTKNVGGDSDSGKVDKWSDKCLIGSSRRNQNPSVMKKVYGDDRSGKVDKLLSGSSRRDQNPSFMKKVGNDDHSGKVDKWSDKCLSGSSSRNKNPRVMKKVGDDHSSKVNWRARRLSCSSRRNRRDLAKKWQNDQGNGADMERSSCYGDCSRGYDILLKDSVVEEDTTVLSYNGKRCDFENGNVETSSESEVEVLGSWGLAEKGKNDQGNDAGRERSSCREGAPRDQDYGDSNRAYHIWLRNSVVEEDTTILSYNGKRCELENGNVETSSDSEVEVLDKPPDCCEWKYTPVADSNALDDSDDDLQYLGELSRPENSQFRKDVEDILRRPYDEKEYETLWLQVNSRKPMQGCRELRGHLKTYQKDTMGKSYLDEYLDLGRKLDTFETDLPRKLNVLRGFFYYLKNMASDGIFQPWLDESCLAIVPRIE